MLRFAAAVKRISLITASVAVMAVYVAVPAFADTKVHAIVCDEAGASIELYSPQKGTTVTRSEATLAGTTRQVSQITIYLDDQYDGSLSIGQDQQSFSISVQLTPGRHTIRLEANDICQISDASATTEVLYAPPVIVPGTGTSTTTNPGNKPEVSAPGESTDVEGKPVKKEPSAVSRALDSFSQAALPPLKALDLVPATSTTLPVSTLARVAGTAVACTLVVFGWPGLTRHMLSMGYGMATSSGHVHLGYGKAQFIIRLVALGLFALMLIL